MVLHIQWTILLSLFAITLMGCSPPTTSTELSRIDATPSEDNCEIHLNGNSIHDMIQIFETPRFDLANPIGGLSFPTGCTDCPLTHVVVDGMMTMPDSQCEIDKQTCGVWYAVSWKHYADSDPISGWMSERDEDIQFVGDCDNLSTVMP